MLYFLCFIFVVLLLIFIWMVWYGYSSNKKDEVIFSNWKKEIILKYGEPTLEINPCKFLEKDFLILVFDQAKKIVIHQREYDYSDILDFSVDGQPSYTTTTSTSSMIGRGIVGGVMLGGVGALAGAATSKKNTNSEVHHYSITIYLRNMQHPVEDYKALNLSIARQVEGVLKIIIDSNQNLEH